MIHNSHTLSNANSEPFPSSPPPPPDWQLWILVTRRTHCPMWVVNPCPPQKMSIHSWSHLPNLIFFVSMILQKLSFNLITFNYWIGCIYCGLVTLWEKWWVDRCCYLYSWIVKQFDPFSLVVLADNSEPFPSSPPPPPDWQLWILVTRRTHCPMWVVNPCPPQKMSIHSWSHLPNLIFFVSMILQKLSFNLITFNYWIGCIYCGLVTLWEKWWVDRCCYLYSWIVKQFDPFSLVVLADNSEPFPSSSPHPRIDNCESWSRGEHTVQCELWIPALLKRWAFTVDHTYQTLYSSLVWYYKSCHLI